MQGETPCGTTADWSRRFSFTGWTKVAWTRMSPISPFSQEDDVQVHELVAVDVTGAPTNVLERAAGSAKDNRLLPLGFSLDHPAYDTTRVEGQALSDADFTENAGAGKDQCDLRHGG